LLQKSGAQTLHNFGNAIILADYQSAAVLALKSVVICRDMGYIFV
jgi:hypothetical protein